MLDTIRQLKKENQGVKAAGFTIIEVMIVLVIAGMIMAIVFVVAPTLRRNARNEQRNSDASRVIAAVGECLSNKNGQVASCDTTGATEVGQFFDATRNQQLVNVNITGAAPTVPAGGVTDRINIGFNAKCNAAGDGLDSSGTISSRSYAGLYRNETQSGDVVRCIGS